MAGAKTQKISLLIEVKFVAILVLDIILFD